MDLSLNPDDMTKGLRELLPEAFKTEEGSVAKEVISTPTTPSLLLDPAALLGDALVNPTLSPAPATKPAQSTNESSFRAQGQPPVAPAALPLKDTDEQTSKAPQVSAPSLHGDRSQPPGNSPEDGTKEDNVPIAP